MILTAKQIVSQAQHNCKFLQTPAERRQINRLFRAQDDSHLWPVSGAFNVTERAICLANKFERADGTMSSLEYAYFIEAETSRIVNSLI